MGPLFWGFGWFLQAFQQFGEAGDCILSALFVGFGGIWSLACAHETMACLVVEDWFKLLSGGLHLLGGFVQGGVDAVVVATVKAVNGALDALENFQIGGGAAVEGETGFQFFAVGGETERLGSTPAETCHSYFAIGGREGCDMFQAGLEIGSDLVWRQSHDGLADGVATFAAAAADPGDNMDISAAPASARMPSSSVDAGRGAARTSARRRDWAQAV